MDSLHAMILALYPDNLDALCIWSASPNLVLMVRGHRQLHRLTNRFHPGPSNEPGHDVHTVAQILSIGLI